MLEINSEWYFQEYFRERTSPVYRGWGSIAASGYKRNSLITLQHKEIPMNAVIHLLVLIHLRATCCRPPWHH